MNPRWMSGIVLAAGLLTCGASFAQMGPMRAPMVPQAIGTHLEQKRTLEQREAIEAKAAAGNDCAEKDIDEEIEEGEKPTSGGRSIRDLDTVGEVRHALKPRRTSSDGRHRDRRELSNRELDSENGGTRRCELKREMSLTPLVRTLVRKMKNDIWVTPLPPARDQQIAVSPAPTFLRRMNQPKGRWRKWAD
jgi:hypothetical protein